MKLIVRLNTIELEKDTVIDLSPNGASVDIDISSYGTVEYNLGITVSKEDLLSAMQILINSK
jgi:hypothetical protein